MIERKAISISDATEGMSLGGTIEDRMGRPLMKPGDVLSDYKIERLRRLGLGTLQIQYDNGVDIDPDKILSDKARENVEKYRVEDPNKVHLEQVVKDRICEGVKFLYANPDPVQLAETTQAVTYELMEAINKNDAVAVNIADLKVSDEYTLEHSVDVATISMITAKKKGKSQKELFEIGMAGLMHDIGKTKVPPEILNKPAKLTFEEFKEMKKHSLYSYQMVKDNTSISNDVKLAMLQHHEKLDGSGYPYGIKGDEIHPYAKIITIADIFDALVTNRPYKRGIAPKEAVEMIMGMTETLDMKDLKSFLSTMILYPVDSLVQLSNGEVARVVKKNPDFLLRPMVVGVTSGTVYDLGDIRCMNLVIV